jgi:hypothetical protein
MNKPDFDLESLKMLSKYAADEFTALPPVDDVVAQHNKELCLSVLTDFGRGDYEAIATGALSILAHFLSTEQFCALLVHGGFASVAALNLMGSEQQH